MPVGAASTAVDVFAGIRRRRAMPAGTSHRRFIVQRLIKALDDARSRYDEWVDKLAHPGLRDLLQRVAGVRWRIAESLVAQMVGPVPG